MSAVHHPIEDYVLGNSAQEQERLKLQARFLEKWTEQFLLSAGLDLGMSVLDLAQALAAAHDISSRADATGH